MVDAFPNRILNIHPSLLPKYPGLHPQQQALDDGATVSGATVHFVNRGSGRMMSVIGKRRIERPA